MAIRFALPNVILAPHRLVQHARCDKLRESVTRFAVAAVAASRFAVRSDNDPYDADMFDLTATLRLSQAPPRVWAARWFSRSPKPADALLVVATRPARQTAAVIGKLGRAIVAACDADPTDCELPRLDAEFGRIDSSAMSRAMVFLADQEISLRSGRGWRNRVLGVSA